MTKSTKRIKPVNASTVPVSLNDEVVAETLPLPWVHYPNHYGTFFAFSEERDSEQYFCMCTKQAIKNYLELSKKSKSNYSTPTARAILSDKVFPSTISKRSVEEPKFLPRFKASLCHRCNLSTPSLRYCTAMYGGNFKQFFGWYVDQTKYRLGFAELEYIVGYCPNEISSPIENIKALLENIYELSKKNEPFCRDTFQEITALQKEASKKGRELEKIAENITREEFGFCKVGEGNISESILASIVQMIFPNKTLLRNIRPKILEGLEIDIFLPDLNLGFEYQGQQHFHPVKAWGGTKALHGVQERDRKKRALCKTNNITLIEVDYTEPLEFNYIKNKTDKLSSS